jgi:Inner membrane protein YgaP-like, transmembrane domain
MYGGPKEIDMTKNMGTIDRAVRVLIAIIVAALYFTGQIGGVVAGVLGALSLVFVLTSLMGSCPLYLPFGINTRKAA